MNHKKLLLIAALPASALFASQEASAHISYINLQTNAFMHTTTVNADGSTTYYNDYFTAQSNGGWADAADADQGNSHAVLSWGKFEISNPGGALVSLSVTGDEGDRYYSNGSYNTSGIGSFASKGGFLPAFTLYGGLLPGGAHDESVLQRGDGLEGAVQALANTTMGNGVGEVWDYDASGNQVLLYRDTGTVGTINYLTHAGSVDGGVSSVGIDSYYLAPGWYTLVTGGSCYFCQVPNVADYDLSDPAQVALFNQREADAYIARGFNVSLNVAPVPVPAAAWMMLTGVMGLLGVAKRKTSSTESSDRNFPSSKA